VLNSELLKAKSRNTKRDIRKELKTLPKVEKKQQQPAVTDVLKKTHVLSCRQVTIFTGALSEELN